MAMAAQITNSIVALLVLSLITKGYYACTLEDIHVGGETTRKFVGGKPEWKLTVSNLCECKQSNIKLQCKGFQTTEPVDRNILNLQGETCLFLNGNPLIEGSPVTFYYAWETPFILFPLSSNITCS
ncbi:hypothetical protein LWI28_019599 [Acer negundo]|uniref:Uncharacterized protein n=1 Tax=Acer negundo TaxID=4023 RepID=A0AAD5JJK0_ACENE|nr:hypothetical protein LWI28_019599 [Acer negundo]KAK4853884.1 hypothetical protein QYF36_016041 [Acer negundo]